MRKKAKSTAIIYLRNTAFGALIIFFFYAIYVQAANLIKKSDYFKVQQILYDPGSEFIKSSRLAALKNKNILEVDLAGIQKQLQRQYPEISDLQIFRRFPNQLVVIA